MLTALLALAVLSILAPGLVLLLIAVAARLILCVGAGLLLGALIVLPVSLLIYGQIEPGAVVIAAALGLLFGLATTFDLNI